MPIDQPLPSARPQPPSKATGSRGHRRSPIRWVVRWGGLAVLLTVLAGIGYTKIYPAIKVRRGRDHALEVERLLRHGKVAEAAAQLRLALHFGPQDAEVLRTATRYCTTLRQPQGLSYYEMLLATPEATAADRRGYAELALELNRLDIAGKQLGDLLRRAPSDIDLLRLLARQQRAARDSDRAIQTARRALALKPEDERSQLLLAKLLLERRDSAKLRAEARRLLWGLAVGDGENADAATDLLVGSPELTKGERELLARSMSARPGKRFRDQLVLAELRLQVEPGRSNALVAEAVRLLWRQADTNTLPALGNWASQHGGSAALLSLIPADKARADRILLPLRAIALSDTGAWDELAKMLNGSSGPLGPFLTSALNARLDFAQNRSPDAEGHLRSALEAPGLTRSQARFIAREAEHFGMPRVAILAWQRLLADPDETITASLQILRLLQPLDDEASVLATIKHLNEYIPGDDNVAAERAWLELVLRQDLAFARQTAAALRKKNPDQPQWRHLSALAELRSDHPDQALPLIEPDLAGWPKLSPRSQMVAALTLGENGQREAARGFARKIDLTKLRSAERQMLAKWL